MEDRKRGTAKADTGNMRYADLNVKPKDRQFSYNPTMKISKGTPFRGECTMEELFNKVRDDKGVARKSKKYRETEEKKDKMSLPVVTPFATNKDNSAANDAILSGVVCVDVDGKDNPGIDLLELLESSDLVGGWHLSAGGKGYAVYFFYDYKDHEKATRQAKYHLQDALGLVVDSSCLTNPNSFRFVAHDPRAVLHDPAPILDIEMPALTEEKRQAHTDGMFEVLDDGDLAGIVDRDKALVCLAAIDPSELDYDAWTHQLWAARRSGVTEEEFHMWCSGMDSGDLNPKYEYEETNGEWCKKEDKSRTKKSSVGTLVHTAKAQNDGANPLLEASDFGDFVIDSSGTVFRMYGDMWFDWPVPAIRHLCKNLEVSYDEFINHLTENNYVRFAGRVGGHQMGVQFLDPIRPHKRNTFLNVADTSCIEGKEGDWSRLKDLLERMFTGGQPQEAHNDIMDHIFNDLKHARVYTSGGRLGHVKNGSTELYRMRALAFAGNPSTGKSFMAECVLGALLGQTVDGSNWLMGMDGFNSDVSEATVVTMDDVSTGTYKERKMMTENFKSFVATGSMRVRAMRKAAMKLPVNSVLVFAINNTPEAIKGLPQMDEANSDKINIYQFAGDTLEAPGWRTSGLSSSQLLDRIVQEEIAAFAWWLDNEWSIDTKDFDVRWGSPFFHNSKVVDDLRDVEFKTGDQYTLLELMWDVLNTQLEDIHEGGEGVLISGCKKCRYDDDDFFITGGELLRLMKDSRAGSNTLRDLKISNVKNLCTKLRELDSDNRLPVWEATKFNNVMRWRVSRVSSFWELIQ
jgi:hypothetical protein